MSNPEDRERTRMKRQRNLVAKNNKYFGVVKAASDPPQWEISIGPREVLTIESHKRK